MQLDECEKARELRKSLEISVRHLADFRRNTASAASSTPDGLREKLLRNTFLEAQLAYQQHRRPVFYAR